jgi:Cthe_2314-like HEPN
MSDPLDLDMHPFVRDVLDKGAKVTASLGDRAPSRITPEYAREPDEHEFFLMGVASCLCEVLTCWHQLEQIPILLSNHRQTVAMGKAGINRHSLIVYHVENYVIRTQSLLDRMLKLVNAVFHLTNAPRHCRYDVVTQNVKIQVSDIPESLKSLRKLLDRYSGVRNEIIHHHSIKEDALHRLDMFFLLERWERLDPKEKPSNISPLIKDTIFEILWFKKRDFLAFNKEIAASIALILDKLAPYYAREELALRLRLSKPER